eukprot:CAMPEP_0116020942 /NCGR_PEP_ID=MMETSP0321-20121206/10093_1 /TAXON_ID=163516 /ORGANISM="Leptocylindrus danicus var. danicus, Strain B650" /LENGTH=146 /DNA_ID=CAMNT_0003491721 /DNA_START=79 /DNA_END=519 /DNA_ORIENTATION=-
MAFHRNLLLITLSMIFLLVVVPADALSFFRRQSSTCNHILTFPIGSRKKIIMNGHSHVEGTSYQDEIDEIEAMGGDPFFLEDYEPDMTIPENVDDGDDNDDETEGDELSKNVWKATDGNGPKQREWDDVSLDEWDGVEIEGAYFDD